MSEHHEPGSGGSGRMNPHYRNPAGRLWAFLVHSRTKGSDDDPILTVWADYLGVAAVYSADLFLGVAAVLRLPDAVRDAVAAGGVPSGEEESVTTAAGQAEGALALAAHLDMPMRVLRGRYPPETLWVLKRTSAWLNESAPVAAPVAGDSVDNAAARADQLAARLESDDVLPAEVRVTLSERCSSITRAARLVPVTGPEALDDELHRLAGLLALRPDVVRAVRDAPGIAAGARDLVHSLRAFEEQDRVAASAPDWDAFAELAGN